MKFNKHKRNEGAVVEEWSPEPPDSAKVYFVPGVGWLVRVGLMAAAEMAQARDNFLTGAKDLPPLRQQVADEGDTTGQPSTRDPEPIRGDKIQEKTLEERVALLEMGLRAGGESLESVNKRLSNHVDGLWKAVFDHAATLDKECVKKPSPFGAGAVGAAAASIGRRTPPQGVLGALGALNSPVKPPLGQSGGGGDDPLTQAILQIFGIKPAVSEGSGGLRRAFELIKVLDGLRDGDVSSADEAGKNLDEVCNCPFCRGVDFSAESAAEEVRETTQRDLLKKSAMRLIRKIADDAGLAIKES